MVILEDRLKVSHSVSRVPNESTAVTCLSDHHGTVCRKIIGIPTDRLDTARLRPSESFASDYRAVIGDSESGGRKRIVKTDTLSPAKASAHGSDVGPNIAVHANNDRADSAPQQQVVNGWVAKDLLTIMAYQNTDLLDAVGGLGDQNATASSLAVRDDRTPALLVLVVVAVAWFGITAPVARREDAPVPVPVEQPEAA